jgi:hypothetical protein
VGVVLPPRPLAAPTGSAFATATTAGLDVTERHTAALAQILAGNVPSWGRQLSPVVLHAAEDSATIYVLSDYVAIGGQAQVAGGVLLAGHKKDLVLTRKLATRPNRVAIYGWHQLSGEPIQPVSTVHVAEYADYSHGVRLIWGHGLVYVTERNRAKAAV